MKSTSEKQRFKQPSYLLNFDYLVDTDFPKLKIGESQIHNNGVISEEYIKKGSVVCPLFGLLYNMSKSKIPYPKYSYQISNDHALEPVNEPSFVNHSCIPNTYINDNWMIEAIKDIAPGEEITIDYSCADHSDYGFTCTCGSKNCRESFDDLLAESSHFQATHQKYFSPYLKERFFRVAPEVYRKRLLVELVTTTLPDEQEVKDFLTGIVEELGMNTSGDPVVYNADTIGKPENQGIEGFVPLIESGIDIHTWRDSGLISIFIHTCKQFEDQTAISYIEKVFKPTQLHAKLI